jgi:hypothetical protein
MSFETNFKIYLNLLNNLIDDTTKANNFILLFSKQWLKDQHNEYINLDIKEKARMLELGLLINEKRISDKEFLKKSNEIKRTSIESQKLRNILDRIFTTCKVYREDENRFHYEISKDKFIEEIKILRINLMSIEENKLNLKNHNKNVKSNFYYDKFMVLFEGVNDKNTIKEKAIEFKKEILIDLENLNIQMNDSIEVLIYYLNKIIGK